ncbi:MAG TPA: hypothetical protein VHL98_17365 [Microvirga sp.]|nr:hypothetical protein [Microvirga sp.]
MTRDDEDSEVPPELIASLTPAELDGIRIKNLADVTGNRFPRQVDGTIRHVTSFGGGAHWTMIYSADKKPVGCEFYGVRFERRDDTLWVMPAR